MSTCSSPAPPAAAIVLHPRDSVATVLRELSAGEPVALRDRTGAELSGIEARDPVPAFHKIAILPHTAGQTVIKYGEPIGIACRPIHRGEHVHTHNLRSHRGEHHGHPGI